MKNFLRAAAAISSILLTASSLAQSVADFPSKPVRIIVPYSPGGGTDTAARIVAQKLGEVLAQPVVIDNRPGASGMIGTDAVAKSPADGYTMLLTNGAPIVLNPLLYNKMSYDAKRDFVPVGRVSTVPMVLLVNSGGPANNLQEFVAWAKQSKTPLSYASFGAGSESHLAGEYFSRLAGLNMVHVPYKGSAPAMQDLAGGQVAAMFTDPGSAKAMLTSGRVRALAAGGTKRSRSLPNVPVFAEVGMPAMSEFTSWFGIFAPASTPKPVLQKLSAAVARSVESPDVVSRLADMDQEAASLGAEPAVQFVAESASAWTRILRDIGGLKLD